MADVAALDSVHIVTNVVDHHIPYVKHGMEVLVEVPAISDQVFTGVVDEIVPQGDARARTFPVKILLPNEVTPDGPLIKSGMFARVTLPTGAKQDALFVPKDALVLGGPSPVVYVVVREGSSRNTQSVKVKTLLKNGRHYWQARGDVGVDAVLYSRTRDTILHSSQF